MHVFALNEQRTSEPIAISRCMQEMLDLVNLHIEAPRSGTGFTEDMYECLSIFCYLLFIALIDIDLALLVCRTGVCLTNMLFILTI